MKIATAFMMASLLVGSLSISSAKADTIQTTTTTQDLSNLCPSQVIYEHKTLEPTYVVEKTSRMVQPTIVSTPMAAPACAAPIIERRVHFLRFGLGPILDFGLL